MNLSICDYVTSYSESNKSVRSDKFDKRNLDYCTLPDCQTFASSFFFFLKFLSDTYTCPFLGPLVPLFWISGDVSSGFQSQSGFCLICFFVEANVMYSPQDPSLVLHVLTSWQLACCQSCPHILLQR